LYKLADVKSLVTVSHSGVKWNQEINEAVADFIIRKLQ